MPGSDEHESLPARMLESRLLKHMRDFLTSDTVVNLCDQQSFAELRRESLSSFCGAAGSSETSAGHVLFTGPRLSAKHWAGLEDYIMCHTQWQFTSDPPSIPTDMQTNIEVVNFAAALQQRREEAAREAQLAAHNLGYILCPTCGMLNEHVSGCQHITCGNPSDPYGGRSVVPQGYGCGQALVTTVHRIPAPVSGQPVLKNFQPNDVGLPANMLNMELPSLPNIALSTGLYRTNWTVIAQYLYANYVEGCVLIEGDKEFFTALQFASPAQLDRFSSLQDSIHLAATEPSVSVNPTQQPDDEIRRLFDPKIANVFVRVKVVADMVDARLGGKGSSLTHAEQAKLQQWLSRQSEQSQEAACERLLALCLQQLENAENSAECSGSVGDLTGDADRISHLLRIELGGFSIAQLSSIAKILAAVGLEGFTCHHESLKSPLRQEDNVRLTAIQSRVLSSVSDLERLAAIEEELQRLGTLLAANVELMLKGKETTKLTELPAVKGFLDTQAAALASEVLGRLRVQNYGPLMRFLRQLLGQVSYLKLSRSSLLASEPLSANSSDADGVRSHYVEQVPEEWENLQGSVPGHLPATVLMKLQRDSARDLLHNETFIDLVGEESPAALSADLLRLRGASTTLSLAAADQLRLLQSRSSLLPALESTNEAGEMAMEQEEPLQEEEGMVEGEAEEAMTVEKPLACFEAAWAVLQRAGSDKTAALLDEWGVGCAEDLQFVTEQLEDLATLLKPAAAEQIRRVVQGLPLSEPAACFSTAWQLLSQWMGDVPALQQLLDLLGVQTAGDLQFVPGQWDQLALCLREVPRQRLLFLLPPSEAFDTLQAWRTHSPALAAKLTDWDIHSADSLQSQPSKWDELAGCLSKVARERFLRALGLPPTLSRGCGPCLTLSELPSSEALQTAWGLLTAQTVPVPVSALLLEGGLCEAGDLLFLDLRELLQLLDCFKLAQRNRLKKLLLL